MTHRKTATTTAPAVCALVPLPELRQRQAGNPRAITHTQPAVTDRAAVSVRGRSANAATTAAPRAPNLAPPPACDIMRMPRYLPEPDHHHARAGAFDFLRCPSRGIG